jgi:hypothetical protein
VLQAINKSYGNGVGKSALDIMAGVKDVFVKIPHLMILTV